MESSLWLYMRCIDPLQEIYERTKISVDILFKAVLHEKHGRLWRRFGRGKWRSYGRNPRWHVSIIRICRSWTCQEQSSHVILFPGPVRRGEGDGINFPGNPEPKEKEEEEEDFLPFDNDRKKSLVSALLFVHSTHERRRFPSSLVFPSPFSSLMSGALTLGTRISQCFPSSSAYHMNMRKTFGNHS